MPISWDHLKVFLDVARFGGLSAAGRATDSSPATLGRHVNALETEVGEPLFVRARSGYRLTRAGTDLLEHAEDLERQFAQIERWRESRSGGRAIRVSAGHWTSDFLAANAGEIWRPDDRFALELVTAEEKIDIGHRSADLGLRNARPTEQWLAGRLLGHVGFAIYSGRKLIGGLAAGMFVGRTVGIGTPSVRWMEEHHGDRIGIRGNDAASVRELVASGAGMSVLPCFVGDRDPRLVRVTGLIDSLYSEQWLVSHHDGRHDRHVREVGNRIAKLMKSHLALFEGKTLYRAPS